MLTLSCGTNSLNCLLICSNHILCVLDKMLNFLPFTVYSYSLICDQIVSVFTHFKYLHFPDELFLICHLPWALVEEGVLLLLGEGGASAVAQSLLGLLGEGVTHHLGQSAVHLGDAD